MFCCVLDILCSRNTKNLLRKEMKHNQRKAVKMNAGVLLIPTYLVILKEFSLSNTFCHVMIVLYVAM